MKILLTAASSWPSIGGIETSLQAIAKELILLNHDVRVLSFDKGGQLRQSNNQGVSYQYLPYKSSRWIHKSLEFQRDSLKEGFLEYSGDWNPDIVLSRSPATTVALIDVVDHKRLWHLFATTAKLSSEGGYSKNDHAPWVRRRALEGYGFYDYLVRRNWDNKVIKSAHLVTFSSFMEMRLNAESTVSKGRITVLRPGVDHSRFFPQPAMECTLFREKLGISPEAKVILYAGRFDLQKNIYYLLDILKHLDERYKLVMVGSGLEEGRFTEQVREFGFNDRVKFVGVLSEELPLAYSQADAVVLPSRIESFGQSLIEALSCGTPVIAHGLNPSEGLLTAADEIVVAPEFGALVHRYRPTDFADAVDVVCQRVPDSEMVSRAMQERFTWARFVHDWLSLVPQ